MIQGRKNVSVYSEKGRKIQRNKDTSQTLWIYMDDEVIPGMNKGYEEIAREISFAAVVK